MTDDRPVQSTTQAAGLLHTRLQEYDSYGEELLPHNESACRYSTAGKFPAQQNGTV